MAIRLVNPCPTGRMTDRYGWRAAIEGVVPASLHTGQDYAAPTGTPVYAMHSGRVSRRWWDVFVNGAAAGGNMLAIVSGNVETRYAHLDSYAVRAGDDVKAGQLVGYVGATGAATGPHLHAELLINGQFADPVPYISATPKPSPATKGSKMPYYVRLNNQSKVYLYDPVSRTSRPIDTWEWEIVKQAYGAAKLGIPVVNVSSANLKKLTGKAA